MNFVNFIFYHTPFFYLIQSIWRDEAFSYFMAKPNLIQVVINTANDFNPPLYYLLLHLWIQIVDKSDIGLRLLSFFAFIGCVYISSLLSRKIFSRKFAIFVTLFTLFNPMLLYYAFEIRMYSFYALFTMGSLYFLYTKNWRWYLISSILGLYTHSFFALIIASYILYFFIAKKARIEAPWAYTRGISRSASSEKDWLNIAKPLLFYLPWLPVLVNQFIKSRDSWIFPVDFQLVKSVLGNLFTNYEGTPGHLWNFTFLLSGGILLFFLLAFKQKRGQALLFLTPIFAPLSLILGYSIIKRPIYVNRYLIFMTIFEIFAISLGIASWRNRIIKATVAAFWLIFVIYLNIVITPYHKKTDFKTAFTEINKSATVNNYVYSETPIAFLESAFYYKYQNRVFIYNPKDISIPEYIGVNVVFPNISKPSFPPSPAKTFFIHDNATFDVVINQ